MPEGHTIHRLADAFERLFGGVQIAASSPQGRFDVGAARISGSTLRDAQAWGKHLFVTFGDNPASVLSQDDAVLHVHLGLYGSWTFQTSGDTLAEAVIGAPRVVISERVTRGDEVAHVFPPPPRGQVRLRILSEKVVADLTGPTTCAIRSREQVADITSKLGPDPLRADSDPDRFVAALARRRVPVAVALMDQHVIAGVGNIYRAEALFRAGLDPMKPSLEISTPQALDLWRDVGAMLRLGVETGRIITTRDVPQATIIRGQSLHKSDVAELGDAYTNCGDNFVYQRQGLPCFVCGTSISLSECAGRKLYWCSSCQRL